MPNKYEEEDAAKDTDVSSKEVDKNWHKAREDAAASGELPERQENKVKDSPDGLELHKVFKEAGMVGSGKNEDGKEKDKPE